MTLCRFARTLPRSLPRPRHASTYEFRGPGYEPRTLPSIQDLPAPLNSRSLRVSIKDLISKPLGLRSREGFSKEWASSRASTSRASMMPLGHHLVYFQDQAPPADLASDGTNPKYRPGYPFTRQLLAGGTIHSFNPISLDGSEVQCTEEIKRVVVRGDLGKEKAIVYVERLVSSPQRSHKALSYRPAGISLLREERLLVFLRDTAEAFNKNAWEKEGNMNPHPKLHSQRPSHSGEKDEAGGILPKTYEDPDFDYSMIPTADLLLQYSFLTYNRHKIHFDRHYAQEVEGYKDLVVQGQLSMSIMLEVLRQHLMKSGRLKVGKPFRVVYKNRALLYAGETMRVCGKYRGHRCWEVWIRNADGRLAVTAQVLHYKLREDSITEGSNLLQEDEDDTLDLTGRTDQLYKSYSEKFFSR